MARAHDEFVGRLVGPGPLALGGLAPWGDRMTATGGATFTTTMRVINGVHGHTTVVRNLTAPACTTCLTVVDVCVFRIGNRTNGCNARTMNDALLTGVETQDRIALITTDQLCVGTSRARNLTALAWLHLHIVDDGADWHGRKRHRVAWLNVDAFTSHDLVTGSEALRSQDVGQVTVFVLDQRNERRTVRVILKTLNRADDVKLATLEVD